MDRKWKLLNKRMVHDGFRKVEERRYRLPNGHEKAFEIKLEREVVCTFALTPDNSVVIARQFRPGPNDILNELPGGVMDEGEEPIDAAKRELLEETGYRGDFHYLGKSFKDAYSTRIQHHCLATSASKTQDHSPEIGEDIEVVTLPLKEFRTILALGQFTDSETAYRALYYLKLL